MVQIKEEIVNWGHGYLAPSMFAVHSTANPGATARNHRNLWAGGWDYAVHLVSDWDEAIHCVPYDALCWQVGNGNATCEGLEICEATNANDFWRGIDIAADVVAQRLAAHGWGVDRMHPHQWFAQVYGGSDHTDPIPYFSRFGYNCGAFTQLVQQKLNGETAEQEVDIMAAMMIRNDDTGVIWYCEPGKGRTALTHVDQANLLQQAGVPLIHASNGAPWWARFDQVNSMVCDTMRKLGV
ncbi:peptidoglycan recognition protein family protein [Bifidobacterium breve]|uniref:peptidoglycan recognition protein family protein n=1 Tax=Bifidobacterium breve TaxID=1685 RepID=UPI0030F4177F